MIVGRPRRKDAYWEHRYRTLRPIVLAEAKHRCEVRGPTCTGRATTVDHIVAVVDGGPSERWNLRAACVSCNSRLGAQLQVARRVDRAVGRRSRRW